MAGTIRVIETWGSWATAHASITTSATQITTPTMLTPTARITLQASSANTAKIFFGATDTITIAGDNAGGELAAGMSATLPLKLGDNASKLFLIAASGSQRIYIAVYDGGQIS